MQPFNHPVYTTSDLLDALHGIHGTRDVSFRYELLDREYNKIKDLDSVIDGEVSMDSLRVIHRNAKFRIQDKGDINFLVDRIKPIFRLKMPKPKSGYDYIEFPLGVFLLASPTRKVEGGIVVRDVDAYDGLLILRDDKFESRHFIAKGTNYKTAIISILHGAGITKFNISDTTETLSVSKEFEPGDEKLMAINELLKAINYVPMHVDVHGYFTSFTYRSPSVRSSEFTYADSLRSILSANMEEDLNISSLPNRWVVTFSSPEHDPLTSVYSNTNTDSPTSIPNLGRVITDFQEVDEMSSQAVLDAYVKRIAFEASQIFGVVRFSTALNPLHDYSDALFVEHSKLGIKGKYVETAWSMPLRAGALMTHQVRKIVPI